MLLLKERWCYHQRGLSAVQFLSSCLNLIVRFPVEVKGPKSSQFWFLNLSFLQTAEVGTHCIVYIIKKIIITVTCK